MLDLGTGTGVLPRNMYQYGADWTGTDISENQIYQARRLAKECNMQIEFLAVPAEELKFPEYSFDVVTACQCFWYFDHKKLMPLLSRLLKENGKPIQLAGAVHEYFEIEDHEEYDIATDTFEILHYAALAVLRPK